MRVPGWLLSIRRRAPLSREGLGWLALSVAMLLTGLLKSINLIALLACVLLAIPPLNLYLARRQLRGVIASRAPIDVLIAGAENSWPVDISQTPIHIREGLSIIDSWPAGERIDDVDLRATSEQSCHRVIDGLVRGRVELGPLVVRSGFPFGLAVVEKAIGEGTTVAVAPRLGTFQRSHFRRWLAQRRTAIGAVRSRPFRHPSGQTEFHGLRPYRFGDSPRLIHWRTSARRGEMMVREFEEYPNDDLTLIVDLAFPRGANAEDFEHMLSLAATLVWEWCRQKGDWMTALIVGATPRRIAGSTGVLVRTEILRALADAQPTERVDAAAAMTLLQESPARGSAIVVLSVGPSDLAGHAAKRSQSPPAVIDVVAGDDGEFFSLPPSSPETRYSEFQG